jgi:hypothetical protein
MKQLQLQLTIYNTREGYLGPKTDCFDQKWAILDQKCGFWAQKRPFLGLINFLRPTGTFLGQKWIFIAKYVLWLNKKSQNKGWF